MSREINDGMLCVLVKKPETGRIDIDYFSYDIPFQADLNRLLALCKDKNSTFEDISNFIEGSADFNQLDGEYKYCDDIAGAYQGFVVKNGNAREVIAKEHDRINALVNNPNIVFDPKEVVKEFKKALGERYEIYCKAFAINKAYRACYDNKNVITFSHRLCGWSSPDYKLTPNFSVEVKTNFGYGWSSYFFTRLRFKGVEITPFSEWIQYEFTKVSEIVRYSQKYILLPEMWESAMQYCKAACNLSLTDEEAFVSKYIVNECEEMVVGLEDLFENNSPKVKGEHNNYYPINKAGRLLIEYRGEKISGALDFISKILVLDKVIAIKSFIKRIEVININIQPILIAEKKSVNEEIIISDDSLLLLKPKFLAACAKINDYISKKVALRKYMAGRTGIRPNDIKISELDSEFNVKYPDYKDFEINFKQTSRSYHNLVDHITSLNKISASISGYIKSIDGYFSRR